MTGYSNSDLFRCEGCRTLKNNTDKNWLYKKLYCNGCFYVITEKRRTRPPKNIAFKKKLELRAYQMRKHQTKAEAVLWESLKQSDGWECQAPTLRYIPDFLHRPTKTIVEVDGGYHNEVKQRLLDDSRTGELSAHGYAVIRFLNEEVQDDINAVLNRISEVVSYRGKAQKIKQAVAAREKVKNQTYRRWDGKKYVTTKTKPDVMTVLVAKRNT